jgi:hypothetical protein
MEVIFEISSEEEKKILVRKEIIIELIRNDFDAEMGVDSLIADAKKIFDFIYIRQTVELDPAEDEEEGDEE